MSQIYLLTNTAHKSIQTNVIYPYRYLLLQFERYTSDLCEAMCVLDKK